MSAQIDGLFRLMCEAGASDLHLMVGTQPLVRKDGGMKPLDPSAPVLTPELIARLLDPIIPEKNRHEFAQTHDTDFAYELEGKARFRVNCFVDMRDLYYTLLNGVFDLGVADFGVNRTGTAIAMIDELLL